MSVGKSKARIGMVNFINTAPLYEIWQRTVDRAEWQITEAVPSELNRMLLAGKLDLGFISSHEYALHPHKYRILSDLSISATGPVGSVYLFCHCDPEALNNEKILLSNQSQTSAYLLRIILEEFYKVRPSFTDGAISNHTSVTDEYKGIMAIGDEALRLKSSGQFPIQLDLSSLWYEQTGLPFVFAVWAVREEFCQHDIDTVFEIHQELLRCVVEGRKELRMISSLVAPRIPMVAEECFNYLNGIEYDLSDEKQQGLILFCEYLSRRGEGSLDALPLKICGM